MSRCSNCGHTDNQHYMASSKDQPRPCYADPCPCPAFKPVETQQIPTTFDQLKEELRRAWELYRRGRL